MDRLSRLLRHGQRIAASLAREHILAAVRDAVLDLLPGTQFDFREIDPRENLNLDRPVLLKDCPEPGLARLFDPDSQAAICAPVRVAGRLIACFCVVRDQAGATFQEEDLQLAHLLATLAAKALEETESPRLSESRFRSLFEASGVGLMLVDLSGCVLETNPALEGILSYPSAAIKGKRFAELVYRADRSRERKLFLELARGTREQYRLELRQLRGNRELAWVQVVATIARDSLGQPAFAIRALFDVSHHNLRQVVTFQESERRDLSLELHDTISQPLVGLSYSTRALSLLLERSSESDRLAHERICREVALTHTQIHKLLQELQSLISSLKTPVLEGVEALTAIREYAHELGRETGMSVELRLTRKCRVDGVAGLFLYRIVQEALTNVRRHAAASHVEVRIRFADKRLQGCVRDDGKGMPEASETGRGTRRHFGLLGMRQRAQLLGGRLTVRSRPNGGTRVLFEIPLTMESEGRPSAVRPARAEARPEQVTRDVGGRPSDRPPRPEVPP
jgi:PAS domain S-box-containing protein